MSSSAKVRGSDCNCKKLAESPFARAQRSSKVRYASFEQGKRVTASCDGSWTVCAANGAAAAAVTRIRAKVNQHERDL